MIGATGRIQPQVVPVTKVAGLPGWNSVRRAILGLCASRTGERRQVELIPFAVAEGDVPRESIDTVVSRFVVIASQEIWLFMSVCQTLGLIRLEGTDHMGILSSSRPVRIVIKHSDSIHGGVEDWLRESG